MRRDALQARRSAVASTTQLLRYPAHPLKGVLTANRISRSGHGCSIRIHATPTSVAAPRPPTRDVSSAGSRYLALNSRSAPLLSRMRLSPLVPV